MPLAVEAVLGLVAFIGLFLMWAVSSGPNPKAITEPGTSL